MTEQEKREWDEFYATRKKGLPKEISVEQAKKSLEEKGFMKTTEFGYVLQGRLKDCIRLGLVKSLEGDYMLTESGIKKYEIGSILRYLGNSKGELVERHDPVKTTSKEKDKEIEKLWGDM